MGRASPRWGQGWYRGGSRGWRVDAGCGRTSQGGSKGRSLQGAAGSGTCAWPFCIVPHCPCGWQSLVSPHYSHTSWGQPLHLLHASPSTLFSISIDFLSKTKPGHRCSPTRFAHLPLQYPKNFPAPILQSAANPAVLHPASGLLLPPWSQPGPPRRATTVLAKHPSSTLDKGLLNPKNSQRKKHPMTTLQPPNTLSAN